MSDRSHVNPSLLSVRELMEHIARLEQFDASLSRLAEAVEAIDPPKPILKHHIKPAQIARARAEARGRIREIEGALGFRSDAIDTGGLRH